MKILYLHPDSWTGEYSILVQFIKMGHCVYVLEQDKNLRKFHCVLMDFFKQKGDRIKTLWYNAHREWKKAITWPLDLITKNKFKGRNLFHVMAVIKHALRVFQDADVVICADGYSYAVPACLLKRWKLFNKPLVVSFIGGDILDLPDVHVGQRRTSFNNKMFQLVYKHADILRPVSPLLKDIILKDGGEAGKIRICPSHIAVQKLFSDGDDLAKFRNISREKITQQLGIPGDFRIAVAVSGGDYCKGMHLIPDALQAARKCLPDLFMIFVGPMNEYLASIKAKSEGLGLSDRVCFVGKVPPEEVLEYLAAADVNLSPSLGEGLNMVTVEAGSVGTPSITTKAAGISHWVKTFDAGTVIRAGEPQVLGEALCDFFAFSREMVEEYQKNALKMSTEFQVNKAARRLMNIFHEITERRQGSTVETNGQHVAD
ncbi:MAG: glycosyltransferase [Deltaproteobacteria bacterium]|nr:glycosyltransferase [Deltaproteobacteria bacterium]